MKMKMAVWLAWILFLSATRLMAQSESASQTAPAARARPSVIVAPVAPGAASHAPMMMVEQVTKIGEVRSLKHLPTLPQTGSKFARFMVQPPPEQAAKLLQSQRAQALLQVPLINASNLPPPGLTAIVGANFEGLDGVDVVPQGFVPNPPDPTGAVGLTQYVQWVNTSLAVYRKSDGLRILGPIAGSSIWQPSPGSPGLPGPCANFNMGDPIVQYDKLANRWLLTQFAFDPNHAAAGPFLECIAISKTSDATDGYNLYSHEFHQDLHVPPDPNSPNVFADFPKWGVMPDAYYASYNIFTSAAAGANALGVRACAYDRRAMLNGEERFNIICFQNPLDLNVVPDITMLPADMDGTTLPPAGAPGFFVNVDFSRSGLDIYRLHADFVTPGNSTFDDFNSRITLLPNTPGVDNFDHVCWRLDANGDLIDTNCVTQPKTAAGANAAILDALSDRPGYRFAYRNFGDHESLSLTHTVQAAFQNFGEPTEIAWWEVRNLNSAPSIFQDHTQFDRTANDPGANINRWLSSIAMDKTGDMLLGYSISAGTDLNNSTIQINPSLALAGREFNDTAGTTKVLTPEVVIAGHGSVTDDFRWGDYSALNVDPVDDCTFWYTGEYIAADTNAHHWNTRILSAAFPRCTSKPDFTILPATGGGSVIPGTNSTFTINVAALAGFNGNVALSVSGLPAGVTGTFNPTTISGAGTSILTITATTAAVADKNYVMNITGTSGTTNLLGVAGNISHTTNMTLAVNDFSLSAAPLTQKVALGNTATITIGLSWLKDFGDSVTLTESDDLPGNPQITLNPTSINGKTTSTLTVIPDPNTPPADYTITVTGTHASGAARKTFPHIVVTDFNETAGPPSQSTTPGSGTSYTVTLADVQGLGFSDDVTLSLDPSTLPPGVQGTFTPNPVHGVGTSTLNITTSNTTPTGTSNLKIKGTDGSDIHTASVSLTISPGAATACISPASLAFAAQNVATISPPQSLTLTSCGTAPLAITSITVSGDFNQSNNCPGTLSVNSSCTINVAFVPTATGPRTGSVSITDNASNSPQSVGLSGTGTAPGASLTPASLTFAAQNVGTTSAAQAVTLTNNGTGPLTITSIAASGDFAQTNNCASSLAANVSCTINITFTPTATGPRTGSLSVTDNAAGSPQSVSLSGTGIAPGVNLTPSSLTFAAQNVGTTSAAQTVTLTNNGTATLSITKIATSGDFAQTNNCGATLAPNASCTINVTFTPTAIGSRTGALSVTDNAAGSPQSVTLGGTGVAPLVCLSPPSIDFGGHNVGTSSTRTITLTNCGNAPLVITGITTTGDFAQSNNCVGTLAVNASCIINVTFTPTTTGSRTGVLSVTDNAPGSPQVVGLSGTGTTPGASLSPPSLTFGPQGVGTTSPAQTVTLTNTGTGPLTITNIAASGDFAQTNNCGNTLAAGASCNIPVTFTPTTTGTRTGTLSVTDNAAGSPQSASLTGTGSTGPTISNLSTTAGPAGTSVNINGSNFGTTQGMSTVTFNGTLANVTWGPTAISTTVPLGSTSGNVVVTVGGQASNGVPFIVQDDALHIFGVNCSNCGFQVSQFTVQNSPLYGYVIQPGDVLNFYQNQSVGSIGGITLCFANGDGICDDDGSAVDQDGQPIQADTFQGVSHFRKVNLTPSAGLTLSQIIFDSSDQTQPGRWDVLFSAVEIISADGTVRPIFTTGSNPSLFPFSTPGVSQLGSTIDAAHVWPGDPLPKITSLSVNAGPVGTLVTINGANFGTTQGTSMVTFNGIAAQVTWGATSITATVPVGALTGNVVVKVGNTASNGVLFTVQDDALHIFGVNCSTCGFQSTHVTIQNSPLYGYVIQPGDVLAFYQTQGLNSVGGITLCFANGDGTCDDDGSAVDQDGQPIHADTFQEVSHFRRVDLSPSAGMMLIQIDFDSSGQSGAGPWDILYSNVQIISTDGTAHPIFTTGSNPSLFIFSSPGVSGQGSTIDHAHVW